MRGPIGESHDVPCIPRGLRESCVRGPIGESLDVPCIPRGLRDGTDSRDGAV